MRCLYMDDIKGFGDDNELFGRGSYIFTIIILFFLLMLLFGGKGGFKLFGDEE